MKKTHILYICIPKATYNDEVNFSKCPHINIMWKTRCKFAKIVIRMGYRPLLFVIQNFKNSMAWAFHPRKKIGTKTSSTVI